MSPCAFTLVRLPMVWASIFVHPHCQLAHSLDRDICSFRDRRLSDARIGRSTGERPIGHRIAPIRTCHSPGRHSWRGGLVLRASRDLGQRKRVHHARSPRAARHGTSTRPPRYRWQSRSQWRPGPIGPESGEINPKGRVHALQGRRNINDAWLAAQLLLAEARA